jgi:hypothetical protein
MTTNLAHMCSQLGCQEAAEVAVEAAVEEEVEVEEVEVEVRSCALIHELWTSEGHVRHMGC